MFSRLFVADKESENSEIREKKFLRWSKDGSIKPRLDSHCQNGCGVGIMLAPLLVKAAGFTKVFEAFERFSGVDHGGIANAQRDISINKFCKK